MGLIGREPSVVGEFGQPATQGITYLDGPAFFLSQYSFMGIDNRYGFNMISRY